MGRVSRHLMFMKMAELISQRSTCLRAKVGAVIVKDKRVISMGYNGAPSGLPHCTPDICHKKGGSCTNAVHSEANAIAFAAREGISIKDSTIYTTLAPCTDCAKLIINSGISKVIFKDHYYNSSIYIYSGIELLDKSDIPAYGVDFFLEEDFS